jgi:predicted ABC-type ATPase
MSSRTSASSSTPATPLRRSARVAKKEELPVLTSTSADALSEMFGQMTLQSQTKPTKRKTSTSTNAKPKAKTVFPEAIEAIRREIKQSTCEDVYSHLFETKQRLQSKPIAVIIAGPAGAGKSTVYKYVLPKWFLDQAQYANVDNYVEYFMEKYNMFSNPSEKRDRHSYAPEELRSLNMSALIKGAQCTERDLQEWMSEQRHLIIDKPCDEARIARTLVKKLEDHGYDVYMIVIFVSHETALNRNNPYRNAPIQSHMGRERQLPDAVISKLWRGVHANIENKIYEDIFKKHPKRLLIVDNESPSTSTQPSESVLKAKEIWDDVFPISSPTRLRSPRSRNNSSTSASSHPVAPPPSPQSAGKQKRKRQ